ncbi:MAG: hypothetical protein NTU43_03300 [Bacteroidetes bacterium]|nr:hypothetical protein [Bacteroidota bacterium]
MAWNGVHVYNEKIVREVNKRNREGSLNAIEYNQITSNIENVSNISNMPTYEEWKILNPNSSINDYYKIYNLKSTSTDNNINFNVEKVEKKSYSLIWIMVGLIIVSMILFMSVNKTGMLSFANMYNSKNKEKEAIKNQIENTYFGLINGAYTAQSLSGTTPEKLPFYNSDISTLMIMGLTPLGMFSGPISLEPKNIVISDVNDSLADVNYDLFFENKTSPIHMIMKKIGGNWKLDGQKILPNIVGKKNKKKKNKRYY